MSATIPLTTKEQESTLAELRAYLFKAIRHNLEDDGGHKSYEGTIEVHQIWCYPNYFEKDGPPTLIWKIELHCYVIGPSRHYEWTGGTFDEAFAGAEECIRLWSDDELKGTDSSIPADEWGGCRICHEEFRYSSPDPRQPKDKGDT